MIVLEIGQMYKFRTDSKNFIFLDKNKENYVFWNYSEGTYLEIFHYVIDDWLKNDWLVKVEKMAG